MAEGWKVPADHPALPGHFPGRPIVPGVVLLERVDAMLRERGLRIAECIQVKFLQPVLPRALLALRIELDAHLGARFTIDLEHGRAAAGTLRCARI